MDPGTASLNNVEPARKQAQGDSNVEPEPAWKQKINELNKALQPEPQETTKVEKRKFVKQNKQQSKNPQPSQTRREGEPSYITNNDDQLKERTFVIPKRFHGWLIGTKGAIAKEFRDEHNVTIKVPAQTSPSRNVFLYSYSVPSLDAVTEKIRNILGFSPGQEELSLVKIYLEDRQRGRFIGSGRSNLNTIEAEYRCSVTVPNRDEHDTPFIIEVGRNSVSQLLDKIKYTLGFQPHYELDELPHIPHAEDQQHNELRTIDKNIKINNNNNNNRKRKCDDSNVAVPEEPLQKRQKLRHKDNSNVSDALKQIKSSVAAIPMIEQSFMQMGQIISNQEERIEVLELTLKQKQLEIDTLKKEKEAFQEWKDRIKKAFDP